MNIIWEKTEDKCNIFYVGKKNILNILISS